MPFLLGTGPGMHYKSLLKRKVNSGNLISVKKTGNNIVRFTDVRSFLADRTNGRAIGTVLRP